MTVEHLVGLLIEGLVSLSPLVVFVSLFQHRNSQHEKERGQVRNKETHAQGLKELRNANQQEEQVEEVLELVKQHDGQKAEERVASIIDLVGGQRPQHKVDIVEIYSSHLQYYKGNTYILK